MENNWKLIMAGVLDIISGVGMLFVFLAILLIGYFMPIMGGDVPGWLTWLLYGVAAPLLAMIVLAVLGGVYALQRKKWGLALTGAICALICCLPLGIVSIILTAASRADFEK